MGAVETVGVSILGNAAFVGYAVFEGVGLLPFTIKLSHPIPVGQTVTVDFRTGNFVGPGQALDPLDYLGVTKTVTFTGGGPLTQEVFVSIVNDVVVESTEFFSARYRMP